MRQVSVLIPFSVLPVVLSRPVVIPMPEISHAQLLTYLPSLLVVHGWL